MRRTVDGSVPEEARVDADLLKEILDFVDDGVCLLDREDRVLFWNQGAERITGYLAQEVFGRRCREDLWLCHDEDGAEVAEAASAGKPRQGTIYVRHREGHRIPVRMRAHALLDANGQPTGVVEVFARASAQGRTELVRAARHGGHDGLTGALNREYGEMLLAHEFASMKRFGLASAWIRVDVEGVDALKQRFGNAMVENALRVIASTIDGNLNSYDALVRWDETSFRVMTRHAVEARLADLAKRLVVMVRASQIKWWGEVHHVDVTVAAVMTDPEDTVTTLERRAGDVIAARRESRQKEPG
jgi:PAS domain S-box-containing protein/diguanylate cyclase (GGDEF)-like protein